MAACTHLFFCIPSERCTCVHSLASVMILSLLRLVHIANLPQGNIIIILLLPKSQGKITYIMKPVQPVLKFFTWMLYKVLGGF